MRMTFERKDGPFVPLVCTDGHIVWFTMQAKRGEMFTADFNNVEALDEFIQLLQVGADNLRQQKAEQEAVLFQSVN